jgi:hypothetical protein
MKWYTKVIRRLQGFWHGFLKPVMNKVGRILLSYLTAEGMELTRRLVHSYKDSDQDGSKKFRDVFDEVKAWGKERGEDIPDHIISTAIEVFVTELKN